MSRVQKTNRFDLELWANLEKISSNKQIPVSHLLDEGLKYLSDKYLGEGKPITSQPALNHEAPNNRKHVKTSWKALPGVGEGVPDDLFPYYQSQSLIGIPKARIKYWIESEKVQQYRKDGFNCVSKKEVLAYQALRLNGTTKEDD
jgi:hypothetical protein